MVDVAVTTARMKGWKTRSYREKAFFHHRPLGTAGRGVLASRFVYGERDYYEADRPDCPPDGYYEYRSYRSYDGYGSRSGYTAHRRYYND